MKDTTISCQGLTKTFVSYKKAPGLKGTLAQFFKREIIKKSAVSNFCLETKKGEIIGLLGPNGAGKTTLMKMFTGIIVPSQGELKVLGTDPWKRDIEFRKKIALVMGQKSQLWWDIPAMDSFELLSRYYEINQKDYKTRLDYLSDLLEVKDFLHVQVRRLSLGERMKMELMASLLHNPDIIFLDEPTIGLDLVAQEKIREFLIQYHQKHECTMIVTSHYMADVQALCKRLVLILDGKKSYDGSLIQFEKILGAEKILSLTFDRNLDKQDTFFKDFSPEWNECGNQVEIKVAEENLRAVGEKLFRDYPIVDFHSEKLPIERVLKTLMQNPKIIHNLEQDQQ